MLRHYPLNPSTGLEDASQLPWVNGNPSTGQEGSFVPFGLFTDPQNEALNAIVGTGQTPASDTTQLLQAISRGIWLGVLSGTANAAIASLLGSVAIPALTAGMRFSAVIGATNTGGATLALSGFTASPGTVNIVRANGQAVQAGDLAAGAIVELAFDGTSLQVVSTLVSQLGGGGTLTILSSTTWTVPAGITTIKRARVWGGGGGGGGALTNAGAAGGSGGSYAERTFFAVTPGAGIVATIGAGGTAGNTSASSGGTGGTTSFGSYVTAPGGPGGQGYNGSSIPGVAGPTSPGTAGSGGQVGVAGGYGGGGGGLGGGVYCGGLGGGCTFGGSVSPGFAVNGAGSGANFPGGGGGGAGAITGGQNGAVGAAGMIIIEW